jgi:uncharacterized membrane protein
MHVAPYIVARQVRPLLTFGNEANVRMDVSPTFRARYNHALIRGLDVVQFGLIHHWLAAMNLALFVAISLPMLAPLLMASGFPQVAEPIYQFYGLICHQWPFRSFFLFGPDLTYGQQELEGLAGTLGVWGFVGSPQTGYKMAFCERDLAIGLGGLLMGLLYVHFRRRLAPPQLPFYLALLLPLALDGFTQLPGWRESTWEYRVATGAIAGVATMWLILPYCDLRADRFLHRSARLAQASDAPPPLPT